MTRTYDVIAFVEADMLGTFTTGAHARLVCKPNVPVEKWPVVSTTANIAGARKRLNIPSSKITAISFDGERWWTWPFEGSGDDADDDVGALDAPEYPGIILDQYLLGKVGADFCERRFEHLGLAIDLGDGVDSRNVTDDPGCADAGD